MAVGRSLTTFDTPLMRFFFFFFFKRLFLRQLASNIVKTRVTMSNCGNVSAYFLNYSESHGGPELIDLYVSIH